MNVILAGEATVRDGDAAVGWVDTDRFTAHYVRRSQLVSWDRARRLCANCDLPASAFLRKVRLERFQQRDIG
ncbi:MAG: hypothetical protein ACYDBS_07955 [Acidimicrobiales bacterium]